MGRIANEGKDAGFGHGWGVPVTGPDAWWELSCGHLVEVTVRASGEGFDFKLVSRASPTSDDWRAAYEAVDAYYRQEQDRLVPVLNVPGVTAPGLTAADYAYLDAMARKRDELREKWEEALAAES
jgi:hypothetical protein